MKRAVFNNVNSEHDFPFSFFHPVVAFSHYSTFIFWYQKLIDLTFTVSLSSFHTPVITIWPLFLAACYFGLGYLIENS